jgi:predicted transcriptional regulator
MADDVEKHCNEAVKHAKSALEHAKIALQHAKQAENILHGEEKEAAGRLVKLVEKRAELAEKALKETIVARDRCHETEKQVKRTQYMK